MFDRQPSAIRHLKSIQGRTLLGLLMLLIGLNARLIADPPTTQPASKSKVDARPAEWTVAKLREEAAGLRTLFKAPVVQKFLDAVKDLPSIEPRTMLYNRDTRKARLLPKGPPPTTQPGERILELSEQYYYNTRYGTPLAYARPLQILGDAGLETLAGKRALDFGYGTIGHLRLWASCGADVIGIEVDPTTEALYSLPGDTGVIKGTGGAPNGKITLATGQWPADANTRGAAKGGLDVFITKNVLKRGYVHPAEPVDKRMMVDLGVSDSDFVAAVFDALNPGGKFLIYNICPAPAPPGKPYIPWADGHCPFERSLLEARGFRILAFDKDDTKQTHAMAKALGWDNGPSGMDLENDLFAWYTLVEKPVSK